MVTNNKMDISGIMKLGIAMVFVAVGFALMPFRDHDIFPAVLVSPSGKLYFEFNLNQSKHICQKIPGWKYYPAPVQLVSPSGKHFYQFNAIQAERICRKQFLGWKWNQMTMGFPRINDVGKNESNWK